IIGHLTGLAIPKSWTSAVGISDAGYHLIATYPGAMAAIATVLGLIGLIYRRVVNRSVFLATSRSDKVMYIFLGQPSYLAPLPPWPCSFSMSWAPMATTIANPFRRGCATC